MKLYRHQMEVLDQTKELKRVAYYLDMGLGKTYVGSEKMFQIGNRINLLICQKSKVNDWVYHFNFNYPTWMVIDYTRKSNQISAWEITKYSAHTPVVVVVNYELAWRRIELSKLDKITLMLDESSMIQNSKAKQTKFVMKLKPDACILLSGTPCGGKFENLYTQAKLLGCDITKRQFEEQFVNFEIIKGMGGIPVRIVDRKTPYKNIPQLKAMLHLNGAVFMKTEEVMSLPEQNFVTVHCPLTKDYRTFLKEKVVEIGEREFLGNTPLAFRLGLRQLASGYSKEKLEVFKDLISSTSDRLIVFYNFTQELEALREICHEMGRPVSVMSGQEKDLRAYEEESDSVTFCQYQAGAMGLNLQKANKVIYFSLPERSELFEQSKKRIHRIGQSHPCTYYIMQSVSSIDQRIYMALEKKQDYTEQLFKKDYMKEE